VEYLIKAMPAVNGRVLLAGGDRHNELGIIFRLIEPRSPRGDVYRRASQKPPREP